MSRKITELSRSELIFAIIDSGDRAEKDHYRRFLSGRDIAETDITNYGHARARRSLARMLKDDTHPHFVAGYKQHVLNSV